MDSGGDDQFVDAVDSRQRALELKEEGNSKFRAGDVEAAHAAYTAALDLEDVEDDDVTSACRCNRAACAVKLGRPRTEVIEDCTAALELKPGYVKALMRRSAAYEADEKFDEAIADLEAAIAEDPTAQRRQKLEELRSKRSQRDEQLKDEALGKLKDLGNSLLGNFGMSLDNFALEQTETGGYNVSYKP